LEIKDTPSLFKNKKVNKLVLPATQDLLNKLHFLFFLYGHATQWHRKLVLPATVHVKKDFDLETR